MSSATTLKRVAAFSAAAAQTMTNTKSSSNSLVSSEASPTVAPRLQLKEWELVDSSGAVGMGNLSGNPASWTKEAEPVPKEEGPILSPGQSTSSAPLVGIPKTLLLGKVAMRAFAHRTSMRPHKGAKGSVHPQVYRMSIMSGSQAVTTNTLGLYQVFLGGLNIQNSFDFASMISLFDIARVVGVRVNYQPVGYGSTPGPVAPASHVPMFMIFDPDLGSAVSFVNMLGTRPLSEPVNKYTNSSIPWSFHVKTETQKKVDAYFSTTLPTGPSMGEWSDASVIAFSNMVGGYALSILTNSNNASLNIGYFVLEWLLEFSTRM